jgi:hypothetical protein
MIFGVALALITGLSGCASPARIVHQDANSVTIAIPENTNVWPTYYRDEARKMAATAIPNPINNGGQEVKVGETIINSQNTDRRDIGGQNNKPKLGELTSSTNATTVQNKTEYHISFIAGSSNGPVNTPMPPIPGGGVVAPAGGIQKTDGKSEGKKPDEPRAVVPPVNIPGNTPRGSFPSTGFPN